MKKQSKLLQNLIKIQVEAAKTNDGHRCMIAPHPDLQKKIDAELKKLKADAKKSLIANKVKVQEESRPGFNDGLIYPGTMFPLGTTAAVASSAALDKAPLRGTLRVIVVLVDFDDKPMTQTKAHYEQLFFSLGSLATGSVREYYREVSNNLIDVQGEVVGPFRLPQTLSTYANGASGIGGASPNARTLAKDAAIAANPTVNFTGYDNDGDGFVDAFVVVHAGGGAETSGSTNEIWSHKWVLEGGAYTADGSTKIYGYLTVPEDCRLGVCAHELGHLLFGFPDLYDTDYSSAGVGNWCLMGGGSWNNGGLTPAHPGAWCKCSQGWVSTEVPTTNRSHVAIEDVKSGYKVFKLWKDGTPANEYFLVENRQKSRFDSYLPGAGLLVWHIDDAIAGNTNEAHYKVALVQADGRRDLETGANRGDAGDCFPGSTSNVNFSDSSTPNSKSYAGANTCVAVKNISTPAAVMYADLNVKCGIVKRDIKEKERLKEVVKDRKELLKERKEIFKERKEIVKEKERKEFKEKDKDLVENRWTDGAGNAGTGQSTASLEERLAYLENLLAGMQPFIGNDLRPDVGTTNAEEDNG